MMGGGGGGGVGGQPRGNQKGHVWLFFNGL